MSTIDLQALIPNNVNLADNGQLQRALEKWQPAFLSWWDEMGPSDFKAKEVYLRTAVGVDAQGWASYGYTPMPDYRWGIFLADKEENRKIGFGDFMGQAVWQDVPGEFRSTFRRLIVTQGDTEPASVEQQRMLGHTAPSLYDLRNLFQVNVEEGRHLWAMVYLLHSHFGRDGREESEELLDRRSGNADKPRILGAFNEPIEDWLSFFMFTTFTDRDGKYQLLALAESGFDPLSRTTRFMLTEEAHHMFVGESGMSRIVERTAECLRAGKEPRSAGALDLATIQKYLNFWYSLSLDLFGSEVSTNAAQFFGAGLKGRPREEERYQDHLALEGSYEMDVYEGGQLVPKPIALRSAMNEVLRDAYVDDCQKALGRWNKRLEGTDAELVLPSRRFHREQGMFAGHCFDPAGHEITAEELARRRDEWLPSDADRAYVRSLMAHPVLEAGHFASWIAPPPRGINGQPIDFRYVRHNEQ